MKLSLSKTFQLIWRDLTKYDMGLLDLVPEQQFHETRRWRFDWVHLDTKVAIELDGGQWVKGRHQRPLGYAKDCEKLNTAALQGWTVFRLTTSMVNYENIKPIRDFIRNKFNETFGDQSE